MPFGGHTFGLLIFVSRRDMYSNLLFFPFRSHAELKKNSFIITRYVLNEELLMINNSYEDTKVPWHF